MTRSDYLLKVILAMPNVDTPDKPFEKMHRKSTLQMGLQSARLLYAWMNDNPSNGKVFNGRNKVKIARCFNEEGVSIPTEHSFYMTSLLLYLICLEQIGNLFEDSEYGINKAVKEFHNNSNSRKLDKVSDDELVAIRNLRNSLAHNLGLVNIKTDNKKATHKYTLSFNKKNGNKIVTMPKNPFNGDYTDKNKDTSVIIYVPALIEMVESIITEVKNRVKAKTLKLDDSRFAEIQTRFTIRC